eukprot:1414939-Pyramimonas_sp.AAC.1
MDDVLLLSCDAVLSAVTERLAVLVWVRWRWCRGALLVGGKACFGLAVLTSGAALSLLARAVGRAQWTREREEQAQAASSGSATHVVHREGFRGEIWRGQPGQREWLCSHLPPYYCQPLASHWSSSCVTRSGVQAPCSYSYYTAP